MLSAVPAVKASPQARSGGVPGAEESRGEAKTSNGLRAASPLSEPKWIARSFGGNPSGKLDLPVPPGTVAPAGPVESSAQSTNQSGNVEPGQSAKPLETGAAALPARNDAGKPAPVNAVGEPGSAAAEPLLKATPSQTATVVPSAESLPAPTSGAPAIVAKARDRAAAEGGASAPAAPAARTAVTAAVSSAQAGSSFLHPSGGILGSGQNQHPAGNAAPATPRDAFAALDRAVPSVAPTWVHAGAARAEAGFEDPALGWVGVRAQLGGGGVHASLVPGSTDAALALGNHLAGLNAYLAEHHAEVSAVTLSAPESRSANAGNTAAGQSGDNLRHGFGGQAQQGSAGEERSRANAPASASLESISEPPQAAVSTGTMSAQEPVWSERGAGVHVSVLA